MSVQWEAPCGCIVEFEGQIIDNGQPIKLHKQRCARHDRGADHAAAANAAFDDVKLKSWATDFAKTDGGLSEADFIAVYDLIGPLKVQLIKNLSSQQKTTLQNKIDTKFGAGKVTVI